MLETLCEAARQLGIEGVEGYLSSDDDVQLMHTQAREASRMGISGVPFFVCYRSDDEDNEPLTLEGAQPPKAFLASIKRLSA